MQEKRVGKWHAHILAEGKRDQLKLGYGSCCADYDFWIMAEVYSARSGGEKVAFRLESEKDVQETGKILMGIPVPSADKILEKWEKTVPEGIYGEDVIHTLAAAMAPSFANPDTWAELRSSFWKIHTSAFQEWYLGMIIISAISIKRHTAAGSRDSWTGKHRLLRLLA